MIRKRLIAIVLSIIIVFSYGVNSFAEDADITIEELSKEEIVETETSTEETFTEAISTEKISTEETFTEAISTEVTSTEEIVTNEEYSEDYEEYTEEDISDFFAGGYIDTGERIAPYKNINSGLRQSSNVPAFYDSRDFGYITTVKDQSSHETCWTFATLGAGETTLIKNGYYSVDGIDLSELQLAYSVFHKSVDPMNSISGDYVSLNPGYNFLDLGGTEYFSMFTLFAWKGAVDETLVPYDNASVNMTLDNSYIFDKDQVHLQNSYIVSMQDDNIVKQMVMDYGAVSSGIYYPSNSATSYLKKIDSQTWAFNQNVNDKANHAIMIVGWDDNYSKDNFNSLHKPANSGAWLIKNSWGENNKSYMWVSYEDLCLSNEDAFVFIFENADNYDHNYQYDGGSTNYRRTYSNGIGVSNIYEIYGNKAQKLESVAVAIGEDNVRYELQIYKNPDEGNPLSGTPMLSSTQTGYLKYAGYNTIKLNKAQMFLPGDSFSVVIRLYDDYDDGKVWIFFDRSYQLSQFSYISDTEEGQSFLIIDENAYDLDYYYSDNRCARIKAYTQDSTIDIKAATVSSLSNYVYTGKSIIPSFELKYDGRTLKKDIDYICSYSNNVNIGTGNITVTGIGNFTGTKTFTFNIEANMVNMYRLYNPNSGEHFYTSNNTEKNNLVKVGWRYEGIGWKAPKISNTPVYRLYNKNAGDHHYTMSATERDFLVSVGWKYEGIGWYSDDSKAVPLYRQYNPNAKAGSHNYTVSKSENDWLVSLGWRGEGIGWYGIK